MADEPATLPQAEAQSSESPDLQPQAPDGQSAASSTVILDAGRGPAAPAEVYIDPPRHTPALATAPQPDPSSAARHDRGFGAFIRYLYFMRFSLLLWGALLALALADRNPGVASITRGILTPFGGWQWFFTGFSVVLPGWFALLAARIVCAYGEDRFKTLPPALFTVTSRMEWYVFWPAQIPGLVLLHRIAYDVVHEQEAPGYLPVVVALATGAFAALVFWYLVAIVYYWNYVPDPHNPAGAFLVPRWAVLQLDKIEILPLTASLSFFHWSVAKLCFLAGDGYQRGEKVRPGHVVAVIALFSSVLLYVLLMPLSAPVALPVLTWIVRALAFLLALYVFAGFIRPSFRVFRERHVTGFARCLPLTASTILLGVLIVGVIQWPAPRVIPVVSYVVVLLTVLFWTLSGLAFFADHFRLPVLTLTTAFILFLNLWPAEHVFRVNPLPDPKLPSAPLPSPEDFIARYAGLQPGAAPRPVIIVAATGGGIHAAAWTASTLNELERQFGPLAFHNHILLLSTVSGGSVGATGFLREYFAPRPFDQASQDRIRLAAGCSSLQAVAWGLTYPDTLRLFLPWLFNGFSSLDRFDRGWALETAIERNMRDPVCIADAQAREESVSAPSSISLNDLVHMFQVPPAGLPPGDPRLHFPAVTFNTTVVETGDRFLLSNYGVFSSKLNPVDVLPAASFLGVYGRETLLPIDKPVAPVHRPGFVDLSLLTAARLSASFTYVSPATRLPLEYAQGNQKNAFHFVDGGYYDNDGVNSAIEFLKAASPTLAALPAGRKLHLLFIEIRNTDDIDNKDSPDSYAHQAGIKYRNGAWDETEKTARTGPLGQIVAPPSVAIRSGFSSVTRRNRRELDTLEHALAGHLDVDHVVLDYQQKEVLKNGQTDPQSSELDQPLSWHLTRRQRNWIDGDPDHPLTGALDRSNILSGAVTVRSRIATAVDRFRRACAASDLDPVTCEKRNPAPAKPR